MGEACFNIVLLLSSYLLLGTKMLAVEKKSEVLGCKLLSLSASSLMVASCLLNSVKGQSPSRSRDSLWVDTLADIVLR